MASRAASCNRSGANRVFNYVHTACAINQSHVKTHGRKLPGGRGGHKFLGRGQQPGDLGGAQGMRGTCMCGAGLNLNKHKTFPAVGKHQINLAGFAAPAPRNLAQARAGVKPRYNAFGGLTRQI